MRKEMAWMLCLFCLLFSPPLSARAVEGLRPHVWQIAKHAYYCAVKRRVKLSYPILTIIDFSRRSSQKRLWVINMLNRKVLFYTLVAHGKNSGGDYPSRFSDIPGSLESSIGVYLTNGTYYGKDGLSLKVIGLEKGFNDLALFRHIIIHGATYVGSDVLERYGVIGRSLGCPALSEKWAQVVINTIKDGTLLVIYYPEKDWLTKSKFLHC